MNHTLKKWIVDTVAADMRSAYRRAQVLPIVYDFMERYADFYVNMLTRMFNILDGEYSNEYDVDVRKAELLNIAHGMEIFNERWKQSEFVGVNRNDNALYVARQYITSVIMRLLLPCTFMIVAWLICGQMLPEQYST